MHSLVQTVPGKQPFWTCWHFLSSQAPAACSSAARMYSTAEKIDLTGRENIFVSAVIAGLTRREVKQRFDAIVDFSELEEFIDSPLRTYSSGMRMRLAFAVAVHVEPQILLIDEVLSVGDLSFRAKSFKRITDFKTKGCTIVLVSHDHKVVQEICDEALWLNAGRLMAQGPAKTVVDRSDSSPAIRQPPLDTKVAFAQMETH